MDEKLIARFSSAYHPNMNGFVERAFGSTNALARSMMAAAGLPDPYWEKASRYAVLLRNIMPNQSAKGLVRRRELEGLLPPSLSLPESLSSLDAKDYQDLVDTIHMDNYE